MAKEVLSQGVVEEDLISDAPESEDLSTPQMSRRDLIKKMVTAAVAAAAMTIPIETLADEPDEAEKKKAAERKELYDVIKQMGLEMIKARKPYTLKFYLPGEDADKGWDILKIRFKGETESAIFYESWLKDHKKPYDVKRYAIDFYESMLDVRYKNGFEVLPI